MRYSLLLLLSPLALAACVHTQDPCDTLPPQVYRATPECVWRNGGLDMKSSPRPEGRPEAPKGEPKAERPVDPKPDQGTPDQGHPDQGAPDQGHPEKPKKDKDHSHSRDDNGGSSDDNGSSSDDNGGKSDD